MHFFLRETEYFCIFWWYGSPGNTYPKLLPHKITPPPPHICRGGGRLREYAYNFLDVYWQYFLGKFYLPSRYKVGKEGKGNFGLPQLCEGTVNLFSFFGGGYKEEA